MFFFIVRLLDQCVKHPTTRFFGVDYKSNNILNYVCGFIEMLGSLHIWHRIFVLTNYN